MSPTSSSAWRTVVVAFAALCFFAPARFAPAQEQAPVNQADALYAKAKKLWDNEQWLDAEKAYLDVLRVVQQQLAANNINDAAILRWSQCRNELAETQLYLQRPAEAKALCAGTLAYLKQVIPLRPKEPAFRHELAKMHVALHKGHEHLKFHLEAEAHQREAVAQLKLLVRDFPARADYRLDLSKWLARHGGALMVLGRFQDAESAYKEALLQAEKLAADAPAAPEHAQQLAVIRNSYAFLLRESGRYEESIESMQASVRLFEKLEADFPDQPQYWQMLSTVCANAAQPLVNVGDSAAALKLRREAQRVEAKLAKLPLAAKKWLKNRDLADMHAQAERDLKTNPDAPYLHSQLASLKGIRAIQLTMNRSHEEARKEFRQALEFIEKSYARQSAFPLIVTILADLHLNWGMTHQGESEKAEGNLHLDKGMALLKQLADDNPHVPEFRYSYAENFFRFSALMHQRKDLKEAVRQYRLGQQALKKVADDFPSCPRYGRLYAQGFLKLSQWQYQLQANAEAEATLREGIRLWSKIVADFPATTEFRHLLAMNQAALGQLLLLTNQTQPAEQAYRAMLQIDEKLLEENPRRAKSHAETAGACELLAQLMDKQNRHADAVELRSRAISMWENALKLNSRQKAWQTDLRDAFQKRAFLYFKMQKAVEYQRDMDRVHDLDVALEAPASRLIRIEYRAAQKQTGSALKEAEDLFENGDMTDAQWCELAVFYLDLTAKEAQAGPKEALALRAVSSLRRAVEQGQDVELLRGDYRFQALASRDDFKKLCQRK